MSHTLTLFHTGHQPKRQRALQVKLTEMLLLQREAALSSLESVHKASSPEMLNLQKGPHYAHTIGYMVRRSHLPKKDTRQG